MFAGRHRWRLRKSELLEVTTLPLAWWERVKGSSSSDKTDLLSVSSSSILAAEIDAEDLGVSSSSSVTSICTTRVFFTFAGLDADAPLPPVFWLFPLIGLFVTRLGLG